MFKLLTSHILVLGLSVSRSKLAFPPSPLPKTARRSSLPIEITPIPCDDLLMFMAFPGVIVFSSKLRISVVSSLPLDSPPAITMRLVVGNLAQVCLCLPFCKDTFSSSNSSFAVS